MLKNLIISKIGKKKITYLNSFVHEHYDVNYSLFSWTFRILRTIPGMARQFVRTCVEPSVPLRRRSLPELID